MDASDLEATTPLGVEAGRPAPKMPAGFAVLPQRWIVERTFAWFACNRRFAKDWDGLSPTTGAWIYLAINRLMTKRVAMQSLRTPDNL